MLKNIPQSFSPDLMKTLMEMGHTDEIVIADAHFPVYSKARRVIDCHGIDGITLLDDILKFLPLDYLTETPATVLKVPDNVDVQTLIYDEYKAVLEKREGKNIKIEMLDRASFYDRAAKAYAVIATGEKKRFANIILRKGVVRL